MIAHERFMAWRLAHQLALEVYAITDRWPRADLFGLTSQIRRSALSIPTNIAEGAARQGRREFARYLNIAVASLAELTYLLRFAKDRGLLEPHDWTRIDALRDETSKYVYGLYRKLRAPPS